MSNLGITRIFKEFKIWDWDSERRAMWISCWILWSLYERWWTLASDGILFCWERYWSDLNNRENIVWRTDCFDLLSSSLSTSISSYNKKNSLRYKSWKHFTWSLRSRKIRRFWSFSKISQNSCQSRYLHRNSMLDEPWSINEIWI